jgi:hypothetical protein
VIGLKEGESLASHWNAGQLLDAASALNNGRRMMKMLHIEAA